jgi:hypothetical protein
MTLGFAQIHVNLKFDNYCESPIDSFHVGVNNLTDNTFEEYKFVGDTGSVWVPHDKYVYCAISYFRKNISFQTEFPEFPFATNINKKTIILPAYKINLGDTAFWDAMYYDCCEICIGSKKDYYKNGTIRLEGRFRKGHPKKLKLYNKDGELTEKKIYNRHGYKKVGIIKSTTHLFKRIFLRY